MAPGKARRVRRVAAAAVIRACLAAVAASAVTGPGAAALAQADPYRQHMENGVKLFQDKNYDAAIVEFEAAYKVRPKASPLVNIALCQKALFRYPKAIATLELALSRHRDTMDEADAKAARAAIDEMRSLLAQVTVEVTPPHATLVVDGEEQAPTASGARVVELGPGSHRIGARAEGFAAAEQTITVVSGQRDRKMSLALAPDEGFVNVDAGEPQAAIAIDQRFMAYGRWGGYVAPGMHLVQIYRPGGAMIYAAHVVVAAGKTAEVRPGFGGVPVAAPGGEPPFAAIPPPPKPAAPRAPPRGLFVLGGASLLWPLGHPVDFPQPETESGGAGLLRVGYRVNQVASFDVMLQYANVGIDSELGEDMRYTRESGRLGANLRLMTTGRTARLVGSLGGGLVYDRVTFHDTEEGCPACVDAGGVDPFLFVDAGVELDFGGVLVGLALESYFQSTRGIDYEPDETELYGSNPLVHLGVGLRVGYALW